MYINILNIQQKDEKIQILISCHSVFTFLRTDFSVLDRKVQIFTTFWWMFRTIHKYFYHRDTFNGMYCSNKYPQLEF